MRRLAGLIGALILVAGSPRAGWSDTLRIGLAAPLTGADTAFGTQVRIGVTQAIADINADGGFLGRTAIPVPGDDAGDPKRGVEVAKTFVASGVDLVVGPVGSAVTIPASDIYAQAHVLEITPGALAPAVTDRGLATLFRTGGRDDQQAGVAARFLASRHYLKIAIVHDRSSSGKALADAVRAALARAGVTEVFYGSLAPETQDVSGLVARMRTAGTQVVVWGGGAAGAALLVRQFDATGTKIPLLAGDGMSPDDFASLAGPAADGSFMVFPKDPRQRRAAADLTRRLQAKGIEPYGLVFYAYAAVQVVRQAAETAGSLKPDALAATMHSGKVFDTVLGPLAFDAKGDPIASDLGVFVWHRGPSGRMALLTQVGP